VVHAKVDARNPCTMQIARLQIELDFRLAALASILREDFTLAPKANFVTPCLLAFLWLFETCLVYNDVSALSSLWT